MFMGFMNCYNLLYHVCNFLTHFGKLSVHAYISTWRRINTYIYIYIQTYIYADLVTACQVGPHSGCHSQGAPELNGLADWLGWLEAINGYAKTILESSQAEVGPTHWPYSLHYGFSLIFMDFINFDKWFYGFHNFRIHLGKPSIHVYI